jgi:cytochrome b
MADRGPEPGQRTVEIWDLPTRVFHGLLLVFLTVGWLTTDGEGIVFTIHKVNGYGLLAALLFRLVWGFAGSHHSRFSDFIRPWSDVKVHALALLRLRPHPYVGHTPIGGWMILTLLGMLTLIGVTGLFAAGDEGAAGGPLAEFLPRWLAHGIAEFHEGLFNVLLGLVVFHTLGVLTETVLTGDNLLRAMLTGRKTVSEAQARREGGVVAPFWALIVVMVSGAAVWLAFG